MKPVPKKVDKRRLRGEESRKLILHAAVFTIATSGLGHLTLDRVAERAGTSRALVVFHFKSKNKLIEEVLMFLGRKYAEGWNAVCNQDCSSSLERILQLVEYDVSFAYENRQYVSAWHAFWGESRGIMLYHNLSLPRDEQYECELEHLLAAVFDEGGYDKHELLPVAKGLGAMLFGIWIESHLNPEADDRENYMQAIRLFLAKSFPNHAV